MTNLIVPFKPDSDSPTTHNPQPTTYDTSQTQALTVFRSYGLLLLTATDTVYPVASYNLPEFDRADFALTARRLAESQPLLASRACLGLEQNASRRASRRAGRAE